MSTIITKNSATSGSVPSSLIQGELAINVTDGKLFYGSGSGNDVKEFTIDTGSLATTGSNVFNGSQTINGDLTVNGTASITFLNVTYESASVIYSSGSNQFGDASNDTQTLWGTVDIKSGPVKVTGSLSVSSSFTASGLNYPAADNGEESFMQTDGSGNLSLQYVKTIYEEIVNGESTQLVKGTPVYVSGSQGAAAIVYRADPLIPSKMPAIYIAADTLSSGEPGRGIALGLIKGVNTTGYPVGSEIYLAAGGGWTLTRPTGSVIVQVLGYVTKEGSGGQGVVLNPGPANLPNLPSGSVWVGNSSSVPVSVLTSSLSVNSASFALTASYALSASFASTVPASGVIGLNLSQIATASFTASVSPTQFTVTSASITEFTVTGTGVTIGNAITDIHTVTGSLNMSGSLNVISSITTTGSFFSSNLSGSGDRIVLASSAGQITASNQTLIPAYIDPLGTTALLLNSGSNWDINGDYIGTGINGTFQGQNHYNPNYFYTAVDDNTWIRLIRG